MKAKEKNPAEKKWEIKDRFYHLLNKRTPLTYTINTKHSRRKPLLYYDEETNTQRELRYATNQNSCLGTYTELPAQLFEVAMQY